MTALATALVLSLGGLNDSWCLYSFQRNWAPAGFDAPCLVLGGDEAGRHAAAKQRWGLTDEQASCAVAAVNDLYTGEPTKWRECVVRWPSVTVFWGALLDAESEPERIPFERLTAIAAGKLYALETRHARRVAELVLAAKPGRLAAVLPAIADNEAAFEVAWSELSRRKSLTPAEWEAVARALIPFSLDQDWLEFAAETWKRLPAKTRAALAAGPLLSTRRVLVTQDEWIRLDLRSTLAFTLHSSGQHTDAARIAIVPTQSPAGGRTPGAVTRAQTFDRLVAAQRAGTPDDPWEVAVAFAGSGLPLEALTAAFVPRAPGKGRPVGPYADLLVGAVTRAVLYRWLDHPPPAVARDAVQDAHERWLERLSAAAGLADGGLVPDEGVRMEVENQNALIAASAQGGPEAVRALQLRQQPDEGDAGMRVFPEARWPYLERVAPGDAGSPDGGVAPGVAELRRGFRIVRSERLPDGAVALATSQRLDPTGEVSSGGYWLLVSKDGAGWREVYLGFSVNRPYQAHPSSNVPLLRGGVVRLDVAESPLDETTITFPPIALRTKSGRAHVVLEAKLEDLARDSDRDGLSDLVEARLLLDPAQRDSDGDGIGDGDDPLPRHDDRLPAGPKAELYGALLEHFGVKRGMAPLVVEPGTKKPGLFLPPDLERTTFLVVAPEEFRGVHTLSRVITLTEDELRAAQKQFGGFYPLRLKLRLSDDGKHALVHWSNNPSRGVMRADLGDDGRWRLLSLEMWIS